MVKKQWQLIIVFHFFFIAGLWSSEDIPRSSKVKNLQEVEKHFKDPSPLSGFLSTAKCEILVAWNSCFLKRQPNKKLQRVLHNHICITVPENILKKTTFFWTPLLKFNSGKTYFLNVLLSWKIATVLHLKWINVHSDSVSDKYFPHYSHLKFLILGWVDLFFFFCWRYSSCSIKLKQVKSCTKFESTLVSISLQNFGDNVSFQQLHVLDAKRTSSVRHRLLEEDQLFLE